MNNHYEDLTGEEEARRAAVLRRARVEGIEAAFESALEICRDKKAASQAKSNAARILLEVGGLYNRMDRSEEKPSGKELHEMTGEELAAHRRQLEMKSRQIETLIKSKSTNDAFE